MDDDSPTEYRLRDGNNVVIADVFDTAVWLRRPDGTGDVRLTTAQLFELADIVRFSPSQALALSKTVK